jgi:hypothetical protein
MQHVYFFQYGAELPASEHVSNRKLTEISSMDSDMSAHDLEKLQVTKFFSESAVS